MGILFSQKRFEEDERKKKEAADKAAKKKARERKALAKKNASRPATRANIKTKQKAVAAIREAAKELKLVEMTYTDKEGKRSRRRMEPYSIRYEPKKGVFRFYGHCLMRNALRSFTLDQIQEIHVLQEVFTPRYEVSIERDYKEYQGKLGGG